MSTITKKELIDRIAENTSTKGVVVKPVIQSFLDEIIAELARDNRLEFRDFGVFETRTRETHNSLVVRTNLARPNHHVSLC